MTYLEIYNDICRIVWGDTSPPASVTSLILGVGSTAENVSTTGFYYRIGGVPYSSQLNAIGNIFTAADTINVGTAGGRFWGVWLLQINTSGTISMKSPSANQVYTTEALAIGDLPDPDTAQYAMGYVTIQSNTAAAWTAQTDDITAGSDCYACNFYSLAVGTYKGHDGVIARVRKKIQENHNYWFMERIVAFDMLENEIEYGYSNPFKLELAVMVFNSTSNTYYELKKLNDKEATEYLKTHPITNLYSDYVSKATVLSAGSTTSLIASTVCRYRINGESYAKPVNTVGVGFTASDTINTGAVAGSFWGAWLVQGDADADITTKSISADQVYTTEALAIAALPAVDDDCVILGYITIQSNSGVDWVANTDDLVAGSDCLDCNFYNTASGTEETSEWPEYYYLAPMTNDPSRKILILPTPSEDKTEALFVRCYIYSDELSDINDVWDAYSDELSIEAPELIVWLAITDIATTQRDQTLLQIAQQNAAGQLKGLKSKDWNYKIANSSDIPYRDV